VRDVRRFEGARGWLEVGILAPGLVHQRAEGFAEAGVARQLCARLDELVARYGTLELFDDWFAVSGYEPEARRVVEAWTKDNRAALSRIHVLVSSRLVAMAVTVSNLVTGGVSISYSDRGAFERALDEAMTRAGARASG
jgi:hypothetical protein